MSIEESGERSRGDASRTFLDAECCRLKVAEAPHRDLLTG